MDYGIFSILLELQGMYLCETVQTYVKIFHLYNKLRVYTFKDLILRLSLVVLFTHTVQYLTRLPFFAFRQMEKFHLKTGRCLFLDHFNNSNRTNKKLLSLARKTYKNDHAPSTGSNDRVFYTNSVGNLLLLRNYSISIGTALRHSSSSTKKNKLLGRGVHESNRQESIVLFRAVACLCYHTVQS